jgi:transketolase
VWFIRYTRWGVAEGQNWEPLCLRPNHNVDNLIATVDWNGQQIDGPTYKVNDLGNIREKFEAFGWHTLEMNGNDMDEVVHTLEEAKSLVGKASQLPSLCDHYGQRRGVYGERS